MSGCINAGCAAGAAVATAGFGLLTFVLLLANSSRIVCGMSGSNRTPCCEQPRAVRRSDIMTMEGSAAASSQLTNTIARVGRASVPHYFNCNDVFSNYPSSSIRQNIIIFIKKISNLEQDNLCVSVRTRDINNKFVNFVLTLDRFDRIERSAPAPAKVTEHSARDVTSKPVKQ